MNADVIASVKTKTVMCSYVNMFVYGREVHCYHNKRTRVDEFIRLDVNTIGGRELCLFNDVFEYGILRRNNCSVFSRVNKNKCVGGKIKTKITSFSVDLDHWLRQKRNITSTGGQALA